jgi:hypothetical protein
MRIRSGDIPFYSQGEWQKFGDSPFLTKELRLWIDGKRASAQNCKTAPVEDPATEQTIAYVPAGDKADVDCAVAVAQSGLRIGAMVANFARRQIAARLAPGHGW